MAMPFIESQRTAVQKLADLKENSDISVDPLSELESQIATEEFHKLARTERFEVLAETLISFCQTASGGYSTGNTLEYIFSKLRQN